MPFIVVALAVSLLAFGMAPAHAAPAPTVPAGTQALASTPSSAAMSDKDWRTLKHNLNTSTLARTVTVANGTKTLTYTMESGSTLVLEEPVGPTADVTTQVSAGGCGWLRLCVYLTPAEQKAIYAGAGAAIGAAICFATGPVGCAVAAFVVAAAFSFINDKGICSYRLRVQVTPWVGAPRCV